MSKYGERLKMYRKAANLNQKELADMLGVERSAVSHWERGVNKFDIDMLVPISEALDISVNDLLGFYTDYSLDQNEEKLIKIFRKLGNIGKEAVTNFSESLLNYQNKMENLYRSTIKLISHPVYLLPASAGTGSFLDSDKYDLVDFPEDKIPKGSNFGVRVSGDSMEPDYPNGSIAFVKQSKTLYPGEIGIFLVNNEGYIKRLGENGNLESINPEYKDIEISKFDDLRIVGKVLGIYKE